LRDLPKDHQRELRRERRRVREHVKAVVEACKAGDAERFYDLAYPHDNLPHGFWTSAFRMIARDISEVTPEIQTAFQRVWTEHKNLNLGCDDHRAMCQALRILTPKYQGPELRLYRGASALECRRRLYGISWTSSLSAAEVFAEDYRVCDGGSVVLETVAPPAAIISAVKYPPPSTEAEKATMPPDTIIKERHEECEYLIDRRMLSTVTKRQRLRQIT